MKNSSNARPRFMISQSRLIRIMIFIALATVAIFPLLTASSASLKVARDSNPQQFLNTAANLYSHKVSGAVRNNLETAAALTVVDPPIGTYDAACANPKTTFALGEVVCVKVAGVPVNVTFPNKIAWVDPAGLIEQKSELATDPQSDSFQLPTTASNPLFGSVVQNRGTWRVDVTRNNGRIKESAYFSVVDAANPAAHLVLNNFVAGLAETVDDGGVVAFILTLTNKGPDAAANVVLSNPTPVNGTLNSVTQTNGATFTCVDNDCSIASLAAGATAEFKAVFTLGGAGAGSVITNTAVVTSPTDDTDDTDRTATASAKVTGSGGAATCSLTCPADMTVNANATSGGQSGAFVTYSAAGVTGDCGAVTNSPASGSFLTVGTHTVTSSSESGESCSFTVTVSDSNPPTISCPANITVTAADGENTATLPAPGTGTPEFTASSGGTIEGVRSDSTPPVLDAEGDIITPGVPKALTDPYPLGVTGIRWTVTDAAGRNASCTQRITVIGTCASDTAAPTITAPDDITVSTGDGNNGCSVALDDELGQADANDDCSVTVTIAGIPAGNAFPIGTTRLTYTATDGGGRTATDTQDVTVIDDTLPSIAAPADATYVCASSVPTADPSQATRGEVRDANGNLLPPGPPSDNCGVPTVTVTETSSGAGSASSPLVITRTFTATDASNNSSSAVQTITVIDDTAPTITAPADVTVNTGAGATSCGTDVSLGTPSASDNCSVVVTRSPSGDNFPVGTTDVIWTATDPAGNTATATQHVTVNDNTAPTISAPADKTLYTGAGATSCSVTVADLDATLGTATANDNCPGVTVARGGGNTFPLGDTLVTYTATDAHGNSANATQKVTVVDNTAPVITLANPANITVQLPLNSTATSMAVAYANQASATDNCAGTVNISYSPASGSTFPVGPTTVTVTATDAHGNSATTTFTVTVLYNFTGFFSPVANLPTLNVVNAGRAIPVKFSLSGNKGLGIFAPDSPVSVGFDCGNATEIDVVETLTAGGSSLSYTTDQYSYVWKTESSWAGTCRQLRITLNDGTVHTANFKFR